jgi:HSP20 family molecular chaperone IbpA
MSDTMSTQLVKTNRYRNLLEDMFEASTDWFVGFDKTLEELADKWDSAFEHFHEFPISTVNRVDDNHYVIDIDVADFEKSDLTVKIHGDELFVDGHKSSTVKSDGTDETVTKSLHQRFLLSDFLEIKDVKLDQGTLRISLEALTPLEPADRILEIH